MTAPLVVTIPHRLGKDEATRRIKAGLGRAQSEFAALMTIERQDWQPGVQCGAADRLTFGVKSLGQRASGTIDVMEGAVRLEVTLPWLLARFAQAAQRVIGQKGQLMLEKK